MIDAHRRILEFMSDGEFHSGQQLAKQLNVTRASIWKYLQQLRAYDLTIESRRGKGYRLSQSIELLNATTITQALTKNASNLCAGITVHDAIDSTNSYLFEQSKNTLKPGTVVMAEFQTKGKGRRGHQWLSPFASGINFSLFWRLEEAQINTGVLSLIVGVAVIRCLKQIGIKGAGLKWPNDIVIDDCKLGGVLIELHGEVNGPVNIVIGVGLNFQLPESGLELDEYTVTDIFSHQSKVIKRNDIASKLISSIFDVLHEMKLQKHITLMNEWRKYDAYKGRTASLLMEDRTITGKLNGVNDDGYLLMNIQGKEKSFASGELSVRLK
ncbi:MAG: biotin--[acetyl-CoA-carboxylase] ligase [Pseudomonadota bacterium]